MVGDIWISTRGLKIEDVPINGVRIKAWYGIEGPTVELTVFAVSGDDPVGTWFTELRFTPGRAWRVATDALNGYGWPDGLNFGGYTCSVAYALLALAGAF